MLKYFFTFFLFWVLILPEAFGEGFFIKLSTLEKYDPSKENYFNPVKKYGDLVFLNTTNGVVRVYLQHFRGMPFQKKEEAVRVLQAIKKDSNCRKFRKAYIEEDNSVDRVFKSPKVDLQDDELLISIKLNGNRQTVRNQNQGATYQPKTYSNETLDRYNIEVSYKIQLGAYRKKKYDAPALIKLFDLDPSKEKPVNRSNNDGKLDIWSFGYFTDCEKAFSRLRKIPIVNGEYPHVIQVRMHKKGSEPEFSRVKESSCK